jgi:hypothetical protein
MSDCHAPCSCCMSVSMLHVRVHAACPCPCCMSVSMLHVYVYVHVHAACSCPCCMCMPNVCIHTACPCPRRTWTQTRARTQSRSWSWTRTNGSEYFEANRSGLKRIFFFSLLCFKAKILKQIKANSFI